MDQAFDHLDRQHGGSTIANSDQGARRKQYFLENKGCSSGAAKPQQSTFLTTTKVTERYENKTKAILDAQLITSGKRSCLTALIFRSSS
jgi:hypothetical protein